MENCVLQCETTGVTVRTSAELVMKTSDLCGAKVCASRLSWGARLQSPAGRGCCTGREEEAWPTCSVTRSGTRSPLSRGRVAVLGPHSFIQGRP